MPPKNRPDLTPGWAIYLRTSNKDTQNPKASQERQLFVIHQRLISYSDMSRVIETYVDNDTGRNPNRTNYQRLLADARQGKFSHVAVESPERFGRDIQEATRAIKELQRIGIRLCFASSPTAETNTPASKLMLNVDLAISQFESDNLGGRVIGGIYTKKRNGGHTGKAPDGYRNAETRTPKSDKLVKGRYHRWVEIDPERYPIVRYAWDLLLTNQYSLSQICEMLHAKGYTFRSGRPFVKLKPNGKKEHQVGGLNQIYNNWFYAGWVVGTIGEHTILPKVIRGDWKPMLTTEEFETAMAILESRSKRRLSARTNFYLLTPFLYVQSNNSLYRLTGSTPNASRKGGGTPYYENSDVGIRFQCHQIDHQLPAYLKRLTVSSELIPSLRHLLLNDPDFSSFSNPLHELQKKRDDLINREIITIRELSLLSVSSETWATITSEIAYQRRSVEEEIEKLKLTHAPLSYDLDTAISILSHLSVLYDKIDPIEQRNLLSFLLKSVIVDSAGLIQSIEWLSPFELLPEVHPF